MDPTTSTAALPPGVYVTLPNWGNTCFVNSSVQYLIPLYEWLRHHHPDGHWTTTPIAALYNAMRTARDNTDTNRALAMLLRDACLHEPNMLTKSIQQKCTDQGIQIASGDRKPVDSKPGCVQEFLTYALDQLFSTLQLEAPLPALPTHPTIVSTPSDIATDPQHASLFFRTRTETNCHRCYYHSTTMSPPGFPTLRCKLPAAHDGNRRAEAAPVRFETGIRQMLHINTPPPADEKIRCDCPDDRRSAMTQQENTWNALLRMSSV
eukprot:g25693.t1